MLNYKTKRIMTYRFMLLWIPAVTFLPTNLSAEKTSCHYIQKDEDMYCTRGNIGDLAYNNYPVNITSLRKLNLSQNNLTKIEYNIFYDMSNLTVLNLDENLLAYLDYRQFSRSWKLKSLSISHNDLIYLHKELFHSLPALEHLDVSYNKLTVLEEVELFSKSKKLAFFNAEGNDIWTLEKNVLKPLESLKVLKLLQNPLLCDCSLWGTIVWARYKCVKITGTCELPKIYQGKALKLVNIKDCNTTWYPYENKTCLEKCIHYIDKNSMDCSGLKITSLKPDNLPFANTDITSLALNNNNLTSLDPAVFNMLPHLSSLNLRINKLRELKPELFYNLRELIYLDLSKNVLVYINRKQFMGLTKLKVLKLENNMLSSVSVEIFQPLVSLKRLQMTGNPFLCDCILQGALEWTVSRQVHSEATCKFPTKYEGHSWETVKDSCPNSPLNATLMAVSMCSIVAVLTISGWTCVWYFLKKNVKFQRVIVSTISQEVLNLKEIGKYEPAASAGNVYSRTQTRIYDTVSPDHENSQQEHQMYVNALSEITLSRKKPTSKENEKIYENFTVRKGSSGTGYPHQPITDDMSKTPASDNIYGNVQISEDIYENFEASKTSSANDIANTLHAKINSEEMYGNMSVLKTANSTAKDEQIYENVMPTNTSKHNIDQTFNGTEQIYENVNILKSSSETGDIYENSATSYSSSDNPATTFYSRLPRNLDLPTDYIYDSCIDEYPENGNACETHDYEYPTIHRRNGHSVQSQDYMYVEPDSPKYESIPSRPMDIPSHSEYDDEDYVVPISRK